MFSDIYEYFLFIHFCLFLNATTAGMRDWAVFGQWEQNFVQITYYLHIAREGSNPSVKYYPTDICFLWLHCNVSTGSDP